MSSTSLSTNESPEKELVRNDPENSAKKPVTCKFQVFL